MKYKRRTSRRLRDIGLRSFPRAVFGALMAYTRRLVRFVEWLVLRLRPERSFVFQGREYRYFRHRYNSTWRNERAVEVPIVRQAVDQAGDAQILEFGNVLGHYFPRRHDVVDKYEPGDGVLNLDIVDFRPEHAYDLIVSISTLEHVGWDDEDREPRKIQRAVGHIRSLLAPGGRALVTLPLGYNPRLDELFYRGELDLDREHCLLRVARGEWREVERAELGRPRYGQPFPGANGLLIGVIEPNG
jgi:SAM-dependent methyltransferase